MVECLICRTFYAIIVEFIEKIITHATTLSLGDFFRGPTCKSANSSSICFGLPSRHNYPAGWSSLVARQAHNLKVAGSNPAPATNLLAALARLAQISRRSPSATIQSSSVVERSAVNRLVVGSNPTSGATPGFRTFLDR